MFHIHVDSAGMIPVELESLARDTYGFESDDFAHSLKAEGLGEVPGRQITLKITDRSAGAEVKETCHQLAAAARKYGLKGFIQAEYVMQETSLTGTKPFLGGEFPLQVFRHSPQLDKGEGFKAHELHLELAPGWDPALSRALEKAGLGTTICHDGEAIFTASGALVFIRAIEMAIKDFLLKSQGFILAKLTLEATVFHSFHGMRIEDGPLLVYAVEPLPSQWPAPHVASLGFRDLILA